MEDDTALVLINGGGPLLRLKATDTISLLSSSPSGEDVPISTESNPYAEFAQPVPKAVQAPIIDGKLSEIVWQTAARLAPFQSPDGTGEPENPTETALLWDAENVYIGIKAHRSDSQFPYLSQTQHDSPIWEDECIEILIDPNPKTDVYYHLVVNPIGAYFDQQVNVSGEPDFRFAPIDVQRTLNRKAMETTFNAEKTWDSGAKVVSQINTTFWCLEIALPRKMLEPPLKIDAQSTFSFENRWLFNIHRKRHSNTYDTEHLVSTTSREYSYWLPTYDNEHPWWPHTPHQYVGELSERQAPAMGVLEFRTAPLITEDFASETKFRVTGIEIEDNVTIPTEIVQRALPIQHGDVITESQLSWLITELRGWDWFQEVRLETRLVDDKPQEPQRPISIQIHIRVTEAPLLFARQIKITGNRSFPSQFIKEWFRLASGHLSVSGTRLKQQLIADFYSNRGYEFATVTYQLVNDVLEFNINEGTLHEIRFTGNSRVSRSELLAALDLSTADAAAGPNSRASDIYHHALGQTKVNRLRKELSENNEHFKSVQNWRVQREGGKNVMIIEIEEHPFARPGGFPILQFNRVHGLMLGAGGTLATHFTGKEQVFGSISRGFSSKIWNYHAGIQKGFFKRQALKLGGSFYKLTDISSNIYFRPAEMSLGAAYSGFALQDYYQRQGSQGWITYATSDWNYLKLEFTAEKHDNLSKSTDWSYLRRNQLKRGNPRIKRGQLRSLSLIYAFDTRDHRSTITRHFHTLFYANERTRRGWRGQFVFERAGQNFGGDYSFNFYRFELARYTPLSGPHHLNVRIAGDFSDAPLPRQRLIHLGGAATLRGYGFNAFAGDNRFLINLEYRLIKETIYGENNAVLGWTFSFFLDSGNVWWNGEAPLNPTDPQRNRRRPNVRWHGEAPFSDFSSFMTQLKTSIGIGGSVFIDPFGTPAPWSLAIELAKPLHPSFSLRNPKLILRLERIF